MNTPATFRVFLSCVSSEFRFYRLKLANQLGALKGRPFEVKVQEDFRQGGHTLLDRLADYVRDCDLVIHLVGDSAGARPTAEHERTLYQHLGETPPDPSPGWSYTQWEYQLGRRFGKRVLVYIAQPEAPRDCGLPVRQSADDARLQQNHLARINESGEHWKSFSSYIALVREVFYDLGLEPDRKVNNIKDKFKSLGSLFKGREEFLEKIRDALGRADHLGHVRFAAITANATAATVHGLGGIGKTRAAVEFALRHAEEYTALLFVTADSRASLQQNLAALCGPLVLDLTEKDAKEVEVQVAAVLRWLEQHAGWFLIFDNVDTEEAARAVEELLSKLQSAGQVLVTSRLSDWSGAVETLALDVLAESDAADFLLERTDRPKGRRKTPDDAAQARAVAVELGQLALALEQAGAYIAQRRLTFADYLREWRVNHKKVLEWFDERLMQYPRSVAVTWQTSFDQLSESARRLLHRLAWFAPEPIPESLLDVGVPTLGGSSDHAEPEPAKGGTSADLELRDALADLETYSLVTRAAESPTFSVHRLVQDVSRRSLRDDPDHHALTEALHWVNAGFVGDSQDVRTWSTLDPLAPHARAAAEHADQAGLAEPTTRLMSDLGVLLSTKALHAEAEPLYRRALAIDEQSFGREHPNVTIRLNNLAQLLQATNRLAEAEPLHRRALAIDERRFEPEHPQVAVDLNNLALLLQDTNRLAEAEPLMRRALAIWEQSLSENHPNVATGLNNLAQLLKATNRLAEAEPLMRRVATIFEKSLGENHPNVAIGLNNLAQLLKATNRLAEAEPLMRRALAIDEQSFGPEHPKVAIRLNNLAQLLQDTNRLAEAEPLIRRSLAIDEQSFGPEHPNIARDLNSLACLLWSTNRLVEAELLMRRSLAIHEQGFGPDHPNVASALNNLAQLLKATNRLAEAEPLMRRALAIEEQSFGSDHPNVATALNNLARLLQDTNRLAEAAPLMRRHVEIFLDFTRRTGHEHPNLCPAFDNYAALLKAMGHTDAEIQTALESLRRSQE